MTDRITIQQTSGIVKLFFVLRKLVVLLAFAAPVLGAWFPPEPLPEHYERARIELSAEQSSTPTQAQVEERAEEKVGVAFTFLGWFGFIALGVIALILWIIEKVLYFILNA